MSGRCIIVAGGEVDLASLRRVYSPGDRLIGADSGALTLLESGFQPDLAVGDFDSTGEVGLERLQAAGVPLLRHPVEKDSTDTELAVELAVTAERISDIMLFGGAGDRVDQTLATFFVLSRWAEEGVVIRMWDRHWRATFLGGREGAGDARRRAEITGLPGQVVSLIPLSERVTGVETEGLYYPLRREILWMDQTRGVSNELVGERAGVVLKVGRLAVILNRPVDAEWSETMDAVSMSAV